MNYELYDKFLYFLASLLCSFQWAASADFSQGNPRIEVTAGMATNTGAVLAEVC